MTQDHFALLAQLDALKSADSGAMFAELIRAGPKLRRPRAFEGRDDPQGRPPPSGDSRRSKDGLYVVGSG